MPAKITGVFVGGTPSLNERERMKEEARRRREKIATEVHIPHVQRESILVSPEFEPRRVSSSVNDPMTNKIRNALGDHRHFVQSALIPKETHLYLGIDSPVPGTPESRDVDFDTPFQINSNTMPAPAFGFDKLTSHSARAVVNGHVKQSKTGHRLEGTVSKGQKSRDVLKGRGEQVDRSHAQADVQNKPKPLKLAMPPSDTVSTAKDKKPHHSKIESILKEMTQDALAPPLTDIQTPIKAPGTRFAFPQAPAKLIMTYLDYSNYSRNFSHESVNNRHPVRRPSVESKANTKRSDELLRGDLITTSDDESDDEKAPTKVKAKTENAKLPSPTGNRTRGLSVSSSSSSDSSDSSESESSDSDDSSRSKSPSPTKRKAFKNTECTNKLQAKKRGKNYINEKQDSPLNSIPKENRTEQQDSPLNRSITTDKRTSHHNKIPHTERIPYLDDLRNNNGEAQSDRPVSLEANTSIPSCTDVSAADTHMLNVSGVETRTCPPVHAPLDNVTNPLGLNIPPSLFGPDDFSKVISPLHDFLLPPLPGDLFDPEPDNGLDNSEKIIENIAETIESQQQQDFMGPGPEFPVHELYTDKQDGVSGAVKNMMSASIAEVFSTSTTSTTYPCSTASSVFTNSYMHDIGANSSVHNTMTPTFPTTSEIQSRNVLDYRTTDTQGGNVLSSDQSSVAKLADSDVISVPICNGIDKQDKGNVLDGIGSNRSGKTTKIKMDDKHSHKLHSKSSTSGKKSENANETKANDTESNEKRTSVKDFVKKPKVDLGSPKDHKLQNVTNELFSLPEKQIPESVPNKVTNTSGKNLPNETVSYEIRKEKKGANKKSNEKGSSKKSKEKGNSKRSGDTEKTQTKEHRKKLKSASEKHCEEISIDNNIVVEPTLPSINVKTSAGKSMPEAVKASAGKSMPDAVVEDKATEDWTVNSSVNETAGVLFKNNPDNKETVFDLSSASTIFPNGAGFKIRIPLFKIKLKKPNCDELKAIPEVKNESKYNPIKTVSTKKSRHNSKQDSKKPIAGHRGNKIIGKDIETIKSSMEAMRGNKFVDEDNETIKSPKLTSRKSTKTTGKNGQSTKCSKVTHKGNRSVGKDIETIKSLKEHFKTSASDDDDYVDVEHFTSPLKENSEKAEELLSPTKKKIKSSKTAKHAISTPLTVNNNNDSSNVVNVSQLTDISLTENASEDHSSKTTDFINSDLMDNYDPEGMDLDDESSEVTVNIETNISVSNTYQDDGQNHHPVMELSAEGLRVKIDLSKLRKIPCKRTAESEPEVVPDIKKPALDLGPEPKPDIVPEIVPKIKTETEITTETETVLEFKPEPESGPEPEPEPVSVKTEWKIPKKTRLPEIDISSLTQDSSRAGSGGHVETEESDSYEKPDLGGKPSKRVKRERRNSRSTKRKDSERSIINQNPNVCGSCGFLKKDSGMDPIRLGGYKTSYQSYLDIGRRCKHIADCLKDRAEKAQKYIEGVLNYVQFLVGLEITGKTNTRHGMDEYMRTNSECISLVDHVITHYARKQNSNNNNAAYDSRFLFLCLRLQSVLYFKLFRVKKDSASRHAKLLSEYFKVYKPGSNHGPSPYRAPVKGSTGTLSPMSPSPSPGGSVASVGSAGSSNSSGSDKIPSTGNFVNIPLDMFEKTQQYLTYTKYLLHGHRLWEDAETLASQCQEFSSTLSHQVGALTINSSMLHVVDYVKFGLEIIKDNSS